MLMGSIGPQHCTEEAARDYLEAQLWPDGPFCPRCGLDSEVKKMKREEGAGTHGRKGLYQCRGCRKQFTVTIGTIFESSKIPLHKWLLAIHLMCGEKKGVSALQLQRELQLGSYRSAWLLCRRIRWAMKQSPVADALPSGR
jgi:transposase-like protein